jgi:hypothetical protein
VASRRRKALVAFVLFDVAATLVARALGYGVGGNAIVRCRRGHLFTTLWIPGASFKSLRLGWWRLQRCPVGNHWSVVTPVKESSLNPLQRRRAHARHDLPLP